MDNFRWGSLVWALAHNSFVPPLAESLAVQNGKHGPSVATVVIVFAALFRGPTWHCASRDCPHNFIDMVS